MHAVRPSRGQTLILFALSLLLLTLMVSLTLSMGMKVRERTELQTVADAAAFSNAVATARAFNSIAVLNRAQIAFAVSQAGVQSLVSWSTSYMAYVEGAHSNVSNIQTIYDIFAAFCACAWTGGFCAAACKCGLKGIKDTSNINKKIQIERNRLKAVYQELDDTAAAELYRMRLIQELTIYAGQQVIYQKLKDRVGDEYFANGIKDAAAPTAPPGEWIVSKAAGDLSKNELNGGIACTGGGAVCDLPLTVAHAVSAAMGSRGFPFVSGRDGPLFAEPFNLQLMRIMPPPEIALVLGNSGSGWFTGEHSAEQLLPPYAPAAGADDHGELFTMYDHIAHGGSLPCPPVMPWFNDIQVDLQSGPFPKHTWSPGGKDPGTFAHFLTPCVGGPSSCPGVWPPFLDYNITQVNQEGNNFGQPKNFALVRRNPAARPVPDRFNLTFNFKFNPSSGGSTFDNRTPATATQSALATGIAYYHRGSLLIQHWVEPPNLLNPYWRATLVAADTDNSGLDDAATVLGNAGDLDGSQAVRALRDQGYKGIQ